MDPKKPNPDLMETLAPEGGAASGSVSMWTDNRPEGAPRSIGGYRVLGLLGQGGMGHVYLAEQDSPRRTVALKVIRPGPAGDQLLKRFHHEVSVLGMLRHPGIAQIYDAGVSESMGRAQPFFAMELIKGRPLTEYAASRGLDERLRLELFIKVCEAVQHAHLRGIIHRDLKPGNILVEEGGQPKILDFGVARATNHDVKVVTMQTDVGQIVGTIPYMSPEQLAGDSGELDTRSDVYSLGVVLFELLAGRLPHDLKSRAVTEAIRIVTETEPHRLATYAGEVSHDVETIVAKALERDKGRRYQSALDLAEDIRRYLRDEPIYARPPSAIYQLSKFARRHKALVVASGLSALVLASGVVGIAWQAVVADRERARATEEQHRAEAAGARAIEERTNALNEKSKAQAVSNFLQGMLASADPSGRGGKDVRIADVLRDASARIGYTMTDQPEIQAMLWETIGNTYYGLGEYSLAEAEFLRARETYSRLDPFSRDAIRQLHNIAVTMRHRGLLAESEVRMREALELRARYLGAADPDTLHTADNLATILRRLGRLAEAAEQYKRVLDARRTVLGPDSPETLDTQNNLALVFRDMGRLDEAESILRETLEQKRRIYALVKADHPEVLTTQHNLGRVIADQGRLSEAETLLAATLRARERELGADHALTLLTVEALADVQRRLGKHDVCQPELRRVIDTLESRGLEQDPTMLMAMDCLAASLCETEAYVEAARFAERALTRAETAFGVGSWITADYRRALAWSLAGLGSLDEAEAAFKESDRVLEQQLGADHWRTRETRARLVWFYERTGRVDRSGAAPSKSNESGPR